MPTQEDTKVFDVARPISVVDRHHPQASSSAIGEAPVAAPEHIATPIHVAIDDENEAPEVAITQHSPLQEFHTDLTPEGGVTEQQYTPLNELISTDNNEPDHPEQFTSQVSHDGSLSDTPPLQVPRGAGPKRRWPKVLAWLLVGLIIAVVAGYLSIDAGLVKSNLKLPFHIFNLQKTSNTQITSNSVAANSTPPSNYEQQSYSNTKAINTDWI